MCIPVPKMSKITCMVFKCLKETRHKCSHAVEQFDVELYICCSNDNGPNCVETVLINKSTSNWSLQNLATLDLVCIHTNVTA